MVVCRQAMVSVVCGSRVWGARERGRGHLHQWGMACLLLSLDLGLREPMGSRRLRGDGRWSPRWPPTPRARWLQHVWPPVHANFAGLGTRNTPPSPPIPSDVPGICPSQDSITTLEPTSSLLEMRMRAPGCPPIEMSPWPPPTCSSSFPNNWQRQSTGIKDLDYCLVQTTVLSPKAYDAAFHSTTQPVLAIRSSTRGPREEWEGRQGGQAIYA